MAGFADLKREMRLAVHEHFATPADYRATKNGEPRRVSVRWHGRNALIGGDGGYAAVVDTAERIIFSRPELAAMDPPLVPARGATVTLLEYGNLVLGLETRQPYDGPVREAWDVRRDV